jgi:hypothetical protein
MVNRTAPGLNPAQDDELEGTFTFSNPAILWGQSNGGMIAGSSGAIFIPGPAQDKEFLWFTA